VGPILPVRGIVGAKKSAGEPGSGPATGRPGGSEPVGRPRANTITFTSRPIRISSPLHECPASARQRFRLPATSPAQRGSDFWSTARRHGLPPGTVPAVSAKVYRTDRDISGSSRPLQRYFFSTLSPLRQSQLGRKRRCHRDHSSPRDSLINTAGGSFLESG